MDCLEQQIGMFSIFVLWAEYAGHSLEAFSSLSRHDSFVALGECLVEKCVSILYSLHMAALSWSIKHMSCKRTREMKYSDVHTNTQPGRQKLTSATSGPDFRRNPVLSRSQKWTNTHTHTHITTHTTLKNKKVHILPHRHTLTLV